MNDLYVMGAVCSRNKISKRFLRSAQAGTLPSVEKTTRKKFFTEKSLVSYVLRLATIKILFCVCLAHARQQGLGTPVATGVALSTNSIKPLQIGDSIPSALWNLPLQMIKAGQEGSTTVTLSDYKGKLIILDFWATYCSSCIKAMPGIHQVKEEIGEQLAVLPITSGKEPLIGEFLGSNHLIKHLNIFSIVNSQPLNKYFPHRIIPHYVWITPSGRIAATTDADEITAANINKLLNEASLDLNIKQDLDPKRHLFLHDKVMPTSSEMKYYAIVMDGLIPGLPSTGNIKRTKEGVIYGYAYYNKPLDFIYKLLTKQLLGDLYSEKRIVFRDTAGTAIKDVFSLDFLVSPSSANVLSDRMLRALNDATGFHCERQSIKSDCLVLVRSGSNDRLISKGGKHLNSLFSNGNELANSPIATLIKRLNMSDISGNKIVVDETHYKGNIDIRLDGELNNIKNLNKILKRYGLMLKVAKRSLEYFIISPKPKLI
jgi:thiol-disulfide isomerase/thioredoxin